MLSNAQNIVESIQAYEIEENQLIPELAGVFSIGEFSALDATQMVVVKCRTVFEKMLSTIREWADQKRAKVNQHNADLEAIRRIVLMTEQERIAQQAQAF